MITRQLIPGFVLAGALAGGCDSTPPVTSTAPAASFDAWSETFVQQWMRAAPQFATRTQYFSGPEQDALDRQLSLYGEWGVSFGASAAKERAALARLGRDELSKISTESMTPAQRTSAALLQWALDDTIAAAEFAIYPYVFDQFNGLQLDLVNHLTQGHPIRARRDIENYLAKLALVAPL